MFEFLLALSLWPLTLTGFLFVALIFSTRAETLFGAAIFTVIYSALAFFFLDNNPISWVIANPGSFILAAILFVSVGIVWSLFKWSKFLDRPGNKEKLRDAFDHYRARHEDTGSLKDDFLESSDYPASLGYSKNKDRALSWVFLWPLSMLGYLLGDLLSDFADWLYSKMKGVYSRITRSKL